MRETASSVHGKGRNSIPGPDVFTVQVLWVRVFWAERPGAMRRLVHAMRETASSVHGKGRNSIPAPDVLTVQVLWVRVFWAERPGAMRRVVHVVVHEGHSLLSSMDKRRTSCRPWPACLNAEGTLGVILLRRTGRSSSVCDGCVHGYGTIFVVCMQRRQITLRSLAACITPPSVWQFRCCRGKRNVWVRVCRMSAYPQQGGDCANG